MFVHSKRACASDTAVVRAIDSAAAGSPVTLRRVARRLRWMRSLGIAVSVVLVVVSCARTPLPPPPEIARMDVVANLPIAAAEATFLRPEGVTVTKVEALRPDLLVRSATVDDRIRVAWLGQQAVAGVQLRFTLQRTDGSTAVPALVTARTYAEGDGTDLGAGILEWRDPGSATVLDPDLTAPRVDHSGVPMVLLPSFADHPLGDVDADGVLAVRDALVLLERLASGGWSDHSRYHADLDADDDSDTDDLLVVLDKLVDPDLPARLHVKPRDLSFVALDPATDRDAIVLVANQGRVPFGGLSWMPPAGVLVDDLASGIQGQSKALMLTLPASARNGWLPGFLTVSGAGDDAEVRLGHLVMLIAGQSNASGRGQDVDGWPDAPEGVVRLFGNDYRWKDAAEPHDDSTDQLDEVSLDTAPGYSFPTRLGTLLVESTGFETYLIPSAHGGTTVSEWLPGYVDPVFPQNLFESARFRARVSAALQPNPGPSQADPSEGGPVNAIVWYQGESDESSSERQAFVGRTKQVVSAFDVELGAPTISVQLASHCEEQLHLQQHAVAEWQRKMEEGSGYDEATSGYFLVVAHDLPRSDCIHLSAFGQRVLAERLELAIREHVLGESVDGTGPRPVELRHEGTVLTLRTTRVLASDLDAALFTVFDGEPDGTFDVRNDEYSSGVYGSNTIDIADVERDPDDPTAVRITLATPPAATPYLRYMAVSGLPPDVSNTTPSQPEVWEIVAEGTVRAATGGLPMPSFGPLASFPGP